MKKISWDDKCVHVMILHILRDNPYLALRILPHALQVFGKKKKNEERHAQSQYLIAPSNPAVTTLLVSCGCHCAHVTGPSLAMNLCSILVLFQS